jgi:hypothetical protein
MDQAIAEMIRLRPELLDRAKTTLARWIAQNKPDIPPALLEWRDILNRSSVEEILQLLTRADEDACRLRQSSPFCGILSEEKRLAILREYEARAA